MDDDEERAYQRLAEQRAFLAKHMKPPASAAPRVAGGMKTHQIVRATIDSIGPTLAALRGENERLKSENVVLKASNAALQAELTTKLAAFGQELAAVRADINAIVEQHDPTRRYAGAATQRRLLS